MYNYYIKKYSKSQIYQWFGMSAMEKNKVLCYNIIL